MKSTATLDGVPLAGSSAIVWRLQTGTQPYYTICSVHRSQWDRLEQKMGRDVALEITDARGVTITFRDVAILHVVPSAGPNLVSFVVSDKRWRWAYKLVCRDYNVPRKTGDRTAFGAVPLQVQIDTYRYRRSSLNPDGRRWQAKEAVLDVLRQLEPDPIVESWPLGDGEDGSLSLQNVSVRDQGNMALAQVMAAVPGAEVFVRPDGRVVLFNGADLEAAKVHRESLPPATWDGDKSEDVDRRAIRPSIVNVHYQREVEVVFEFEDDYSTIVQPDRNRPYIENVLPTVDTETEITDYDPETGRSYTKTVPAGTWVPVVQWLAAMDLRRPGDAFEWTFEALRRMWLVGDLDGALGTKADTEERANISARVQVLKQHFRQTFRVNQRVMERIRDIEAVRVGLIDPVTGARAPAAVWGQACVIPTQKGQRLVARRIADGEASARLWENIDDYPEDGEQTVMQPPSPAMVSIVDQDQGIIRVDWVHSPYGSEESIIPCNVVGDSEVAAVPIGDLGMQDTHPIGPNMVVQGKEFGIYLARRMRMLVMMTVIPAAPNNAQQFHKVPVQASDIAAKFTEAFGITDGEGPELDVFVPPGEASARFGWTNDEGAYESFVQLLGMHSDDPNAGGISGQEISGFTLNNGESELASHSQAMAAEALAQYADCVQGNVATVLADGRLTLKGNMTRATVQLAAAPSGKVAVLHEFPGTQKALSRMAMLSPTARRNILGIVDAGIGR